MTKKTRQEIIDSKQDGKYPQWLWPVVGVVGFLILVVLVFQSGLGSRQKMEAVEVAVNSLYLDADHSYLAEDISQEHIDQAKEAITILHGRPKRKMGQLVDGAQMKFQAIKNLEKIYQQEAPIVKGKEIHLDRHLKPDLTLDEIRELCQELQLPKAEDALTEDLNKLYQETHQLVDKIEAAKAKISKLPTDANNGMTIQEIVSQVKELEGLLADVGDQAQLADSKKELSTQMDLLGDSILLGNESLNYDQEILDEIFSSDQLGRALAGTELDTYPSIALTFDDGPNPTITPQVLDILDQHDVKATFFMLGAYVDEYPEIVQEVVDRGHKLGNHSYTHPIFELMSDAEVIKEIEDTQAAFKRATDEPVTMYRMPYGSGGERVVKLFPDYQSVMWNVDSLDWESRNADAIYKEVMSTLKLHTILLMHDTHQATPDVLDRLITELKAKNYRFVFPEEIGLEHEHF